MIKLALLCILFGLLTSCAKPKDGANGSDGAKGQDGSSCSALPATDGSGALIQCTNGSTAFVSNGVNGTNATPVTMIQLCPTISGSYGNFPEFAFKINGKLYATYSTGSLAFTAELYPGNYVSTTNGANCSFTVNPDSSITN